MQKINSLNVDDHLCNLLQVENLRQSEFHLQLLEICPYIADTHLKVRTVCISNSHCMNQSIRHMGTPWYMQGDWKSYMDTKIDLLETLINQVHCTTMTIILKEGTQSGQLKWWNTKLRYFLEFVKLNLPLYLFQIFNSSL